jgi:hypothetical protein
MKRLVLFSLTAAALATGCAPTSEPSSASRSEKLERLSQALGNVSLAEESLSPELAAAVRNVAPACRYCSVLETRQGSTSCRAPWTGSIGTRSSCAGSWGRLGHGPTLFAGLSKPLDLKLVSRLELASGAVAMRYEPRR